MDPVLAPLDGSLATLIDFVDFHVEQNPRSPWLVFPSTTSGDTLSYISYTAMANASHRIASIVRPGRSGPDYQVIAVLLHTDSVIYVPILLGLWRAGYIPFPMSPRNSAEGICHMLQSTGCRHILFNSPTSKRVSQVNTQIASHGVLLQLSDLDIFHDILSDLLSDQATTLESAAYPPPAHETNPDLPMLYLHSSGSTGLPKSVPVIRRQFLQNLRRNIFGTKRSNTRFGAMSLPTFHSMGLILQIFLPLSASHAVATFTPQYPAPPVVASPKSVLAVSKIAQIQGLIAPPSFVEAWSHSQDDIAYLKSLKVLVFGGGPLSTAVGDKMASEGVPLFSGYGGSEFGNPTQSWDEGSESQLTRNADWAWVRFSKYIKTELQPQDDNTYELIIHDTDDYKVRVHNVPGKKAYATSDLFQRHPVKEDLWRIVGRKDDVITLSTGEKIIPIAQEGRLNASPMVSGCVMFGREQEQAGLLVEVASDYAFPSNDENALVDFRKKIWPTVDEANSSSPAFARIFKEMILVTDPSKPLPRSGKNTIIRKQAIALYSSDIEKLYLSVKESTEIRDVHTPGSWKGEDLASWLQNEASSIIGKSTVDQNTSLFHQGFDSLSATFFRNRIIGALRSSSADSIRRAAQNISSNFIFEHPALNDLTATISALVNLPHDQAVTSAVRIDDISALVAKYTQDLPPPQARQAQEAPGSPVVLLTGSTGNIGSHILAHLLADCRISRVYTLDRPSPDPKARLKAAFVDRHLSPELLEESKLVSLAGDLTKSHFGVEERIYNELMESTTHVIHNAWAVNFNLPLQAFEAQITGVRKLIEASASAARPMKLLVTSSIGVTRGHNPADGPVPERLMGDPGVATSNGYTASKYVVEEILQAAAGLGHSVMCVRMGQVCGPRATGAWGTSEWIPIMLKTSIALGCFPDMSGPVSWVPLDVIGQAYIDWIVTPDTLPFLVNVVHPRPTTWSAVLKAVGEAVGTRMATVPLNDWIGQLEERSPNATLEDLARYPALKILDFFRSVQAGVNHTDSAIAGVDGDVQLNKGYDTDELLHSSPSMRDLQPISEEHAKAWIEFWKSKRYIVDV